MSVVVYDEHGMMGVWEFSWLEAVYVVTDAKLSQPRSFTIS